MRVVRTCLRLLQRKFAYVLVQRAELTWIDSRLCRLFLLGLICSLRSADEWDHKLGRFLDVYCFCCGHDLEFTGLLIRACSILAGNLAVFGMFCFVLISKPK
jgi:hypothetical protein